MYAGTLTVRDDTFMKNVTSAKKILPILVGMGIHHAKKTALLFLAGLGSIKGPR
jgi:hypothetical protein